MIAAVGSNRSFSGLGRYLVEAKDGPQEERVAWLTSRNLPTDDPQVAVTIMTATARENARVDRAAYHLEISFDPSDNVNREKMEHVADTLLRDLGLHEHQTLIVAHGDRRHPHVHLLVNRVHPETGRVWNRWQDRTRIQEILRKEERALGLRVLESSVVPRDRTSERSRDAERTEPQQSEHHSRQQEGKYGAIRKDLDTYEQVNEAARERSRAELAAARAQERLNLIELAAERVARAEAAFEKSLERVYADSAAAKRAFVDAFQRRGEAAQRELVDRPESFGALRMTERRGFLGRMQSSDIDARAAVPAAAEGASVWIGEHRRLVDTVMHGRDAGAVRPEPLEPTHERVTEAQRELTAARENVRASQAAARTLPGREELEYRLRRALSRLSPQEFDHFRKTVPPARLAMAYQFRRLVRDAVLGRDEGV